MYSQRVKRTVLARFTLFFYAILIPNSRNKRKVPLTIPLHRPSRSEQKKHGTITYFR